MRLAQNLKSYMVNCCFKANMPSNNELKVSQCSKTDMILIQNLKFYMLSLLLQDWHKFQYQTKIILML